jgi:hypothetical protein
MTVAFEAAAVDERRAAILGIVLGASFYTCALTGLFSWGASSNQGWWPSGPVGLFRLTQGAHLISGVTNVAYWYPQEFYGVDIGYFFPAADGTIAIIVVSALFAHILAKISTTRRALRREVLENESREATVDRRRFLGGVAAATGLVGVTIARGRRVPTIACWLS